MRPTQLDCIGDPVDYSIIRSSRMMTARRMRDPRMIQL
jgi:hypothetical protein